MSKLCTFANIAVSDRMWQQTVLAFYLNCIVKKLVERILPAFGILRELYIQGVPGGKLNILGGHRDGHSKQNVYMYMCPIPNSFRDRAISLYSRAARHVLTQVTKCLDVDGGLFENVLY
jgi:hypothetical protein